MHLLFGYPRFDQTEYLREVSCHSTWVDCNQMRFMFLDGYHKLDTNLNISDEFSSVFYPKRILNISKIFFGLRNQNTEKRNIQV